MGSASTIPLMGQQPTFTTPGQYAQQGLGLQNLALGNALQAQRIKEASVQAQQQAAALAANQQIQQSFVTNGGDYDKTRQDIIGKVPLQFVQKFDQDHLENQRAALAMSNEQKVKTNLDNQALGQAAAALIQLPYKQRAAQLPATLSGLQKQGIDTTQYQNFDPTDDNLNYALAHTGYTGQVTSWALKQAQADQRTATASKLAEQEKDASQKAQQAKASQEREDIARQYLGVNDQPTHDAWMDAVNKNYPEVAKEYANFKTFGPGNAQIINGMALNAQQRSADANSAKKVKDAEDKATAAANAAPKTPAELAVIAGDSTKPQAERNAANAALKILKDQRPVTTVNIGAPGLANTDVNLTGQEFLNSLPKATAAQVRAIAEGRATIPSGSARTQAAQQMRNAVFQYDPTYSDQRAQVRKAFTTGTDGRNIGALNTAPVHLDQLADAAAALSNGSFRPGNQIWNSIRSTFGASAPTNFDGLKSAVSSEMATALKGNATDQEIKAINNTIQSSSSPKQLAGIIDTNLDILKAKLNTYKERYDQQLPGDTVYSPVLPSAKAVFDKHAASTVIPPAVTQLLSGKNVAPGIHKLSDGSTYIKAADGTITKQ